MKWIIAAALLAALAGCEASEGNRTDADANASDNAAATAAPATLRFVNSRQNALSDNLRRFYVDFSFNYPAGWTVTPPRTDGTERNFVRVAAPPVEGYEPFSFHVGFATGSGDPEQDRREIGQALPRVAEQFGSTLENYRVASTGRARVGGNESWNWRFSATAPAVEGGRPARLVGRGDILLPPGERRGVLIITLVTDRTDEVRTPEEVGEVGTLKAVYDSFRLGAADSGRN
jgi:hypothetical protein